MTTTTLRMSPPSPQDASSPSKRSVKKRTGTTRGRIGCLTCRQRRKKCDENTYPICGHCKRLNLNCVRESPRTLPTSPKDVEIIEFPREISRIPDSVHVSSFVLGRGLTDRRYLMKYYTSILTNLCTTNHENNSFLSVFLPMALESPPLLSSLIAWSSAHLSCFDPSYQITALEKQSIAFNAVSNSLLLNSDSDSLQETELASCLVLCATEVSLGDTSRWYDHLVGAKHIIGTKTKAFMNSLDGAWLLRNFAYHDILGSVTTGQEPLLKGDYFFHDRVEVIDAYFGCATKILALISEVSCLSSGETKPGRVLEEDMDSKSSDEEDIWQRYRTLENTIREWTCAAVPQQGLISMAYAYRGAACIYIYRKWRKALQQKYFSPSPSAADHISTLESKISSAVKDTLHHISKVPPTSLPECGLLFPLFMAGGDTTDETHIEVIRMRLKTLLDHRGFRNIKTATEVLEELWRLKAIGLKNSDGLQIDWMDVLQRLGIKLILA